VTDAQRTKYLKALAKYGLESAAADAAGILVPEAQRLAGVDQRFADECEHAMCAAIDEVEAKLRSLALKGEHQGPNKPRKFNPKYFQMYLAAKRPAAYSPARKMRREGQKAKKDNSPAGVRARLDSMSDDELNAKLVQPVDP